ncbi:MAG: hypothetical protein U1E89_16300 [Burkholderiaceae bacterium]
MRNDMLRTGSVDVIDDTGRRWIVDEYTEVLEDATLSFPGAELAGLHEYRLGDEPCSLDQDGSFRVVRTGQRLRRP